MTTIALFGAAGKIGTCIANRLREDSDYRTLYLEAGRPAWPGCVNAA